MTTATDSSRLGVLENVRAVLASRREKRERISLVTPAQPKSKEDATRELAELYGLRDEVAVQIKSLELFLGIQAKPVHRKAPSTKGKVGRPKGFRKPTLNIFELFAEGDRLTRHDVIKRSREKYGDTYPDTTITGALHRLVSKDALKHNNFFYYRPRKAKHEEPTNDVH